MQIAFVFQQIHCWMEVAAINLTTKDHVNMVIGLSTAALSSRNAYAKRSTLFLIAQFKQK